MSALDKMVEAMLKASGLNLDEVKNQVTTRIANFEGNVQTLNSTLISIMETLRRIEHNLKRSMREQGIEYEDAPIIAPKVINGEAHHAG